MSRGPRVALLVLLLTAPVAADPLPPARRYANLSPTAAYRELGRRGIRYARATAARGVLLPVRLRGPLHGVSWHTGLDAKARHATPFEVFDARLVLALDDFSASLAAHGIDQALIFSAWRPAPKGARVAPSEARHPGAMAVDVKALHRRGGAWLDVENDFHGSVGATVCGEGAAKPDPSTPVADELRIIVCGAARAKLFTSILTPDYDSPHHDHLHLELRPKVAWMIVR